jgi:hypothetical protein
MFHCKSHKSELELKLDYFRQWNIQEEIKYTAYLVSKANLVHNFSEYIYQSLHVSGDYVPIMRSNNCVYATLGTFYSVWMTVWYAG